MAPSVLLYLRALVFYTGVMTTLCVFAPLALIIRSLPYRTRYRLIIQIWAHLNIRWLDKSCRLGFRVTGTEHLPDGPAIIICKHQSAWEIFALQEVFPPYFWVLKREVLWLPLFGWGLDARSHRHRPQGRDRGPAPDPAHRQRAAPERAWGHHLPRGHARASRRAPPL